MADFGIGRTGGSLRDALNSLYPMTGLGEYNTAYPPMMFPPASGADQPTASVPLPQSRPPLPGYPQQPPGQTRPPLPGGPGVAGPLPPRPVVPGYPPPQQGLTRPPLPGGPVPQQGLTRPPLPQQGGLPPELLSYAARLGLVG